MLASAASFSVSSRRSLAVGFQHVVAVIAKRNAALRLTAAEFTDELDAELSITSAAISRSLNSVFLDSDPYSHDAVMLIDAAPPAPVIDIVPAVCLSAGTAARRRRRVACSLAPSSRSIPDGADVCSWQEALAPMPPVQGRPIDATTSLHRHAHSASTMVSSSSAGSSDSLTLYSTADSITTADSSTPSLLAHRDFATTLFSLRSRPKDYPTSRLAVVVDVEVQTVADFTLQDQTF
ncbi:hypothetical protein EV121DRAFT_192138 [Schizophyllum commune]